MAQQQQHAIILGGGPVGLAAALLLRKEGYEVDVYEFRSEIPRDNSNSYPIGVNPRGQKTLELINPRLVDEMKKCGRTVEAFKIFAGTRQVADMKSGTLIGTTRGDVNSILYKEAVARNDPALRIHFNHKVKRLDISAKKLTLETPEGEKVIDGSSARVFAADGVWSSARKAMEEQLEDFKAEIGEWGVQFRVIMSKPGATSPDLNPDNHYIIGPKGVYTSIISGSTWVVSLTIKPGEKDQPLLSAQEATPENVKNLRKYVEEFAPMSAKLLDDEDYAKFFGRKSFTGAVVKCPRVNAGEWLCLLGDAAHAVIPPTGEGVNSGLEDCSVLVDVLSQLKKAGKEESLFSAYNDARMPDLQALGEYAWFLMEGLRGTDKKRKIAQTVTQIMLAVGKKMGLTQATVEDNLFGPKAVERMPYRDVCGQWKSQKDRVWPYASGVAWFLGLFV
eukprot:comp19072_c1_seq1/m.21553 comp19072_c1_seq1/g.21553  ORF comp19072_c1_seq1/g.21553 comp19072_c1_seq1/m.21553 type:complete len:447 (-) comp19072_c1_seq1:644-1984(-)